jgi:hypothetical protein
VESQLAFEMEFADSEIRQTLWKGDDLHVLFSAVAAIRHTQGQAPVSGFLQGVELVLLRCEPASTAALFGRIRSGGLRLAGQAPSPRISVPSRCELPLTLELEPAQAGTLVFRAQSMECRLQAGNAFRESLFC